MATSTLDIGDLYSILGARGIEKQVMRIPGMTLVAVNPVSGATTVDFDPGKTDLATIQSAIRACGYHCAGQAMPKHVCEAHPAAEREEAVAQRAKVGVGEHAGMAMPMAVAGKPDAKSTHKQHAGAQTDAMANEMGHGAGMDKIGRAHV